MITNVVRRRSFYSKNKKFGWEIIHNLYRPGRSYSETNKIPLNCYERSLQSYFKFLNKKNLVIINPNRARQQQYAKSLLSSIQTIIKKSSQPRTVTSKNYINTSVSTLTKFFSKLLIGSLKNIKLEKDKIFMDA